MKLLVVLCCLLSTSASKARLLGSALRRGSSKAKLSLAKAKQLPGFDDPRTLFPVSVGGDPSTGNGPLNPEFFGGQGVQDRSSSTGSGGDCHPKCHWTCGTNECDQSCEPVCAPPQCETACSPINLATCAQVCDPPKCAVVCPSTHCEHGDCPRCKTICAPAVCSTTCSESCESKCADPQCTWTCTPGDCPQPACAVKCDGPKLCGFNAQVDARPPPFTDGMTVLSRSLAGLDPAAVAAPAAAM